MAPAAPHARAHARGCIRSSHHVDGADAAAAVALLQPPSQHLPSIWLPCLGLCMEAAALQHPSAVHWLPRQLAEPRLPPLHPHLHLPANSHATILSGWAFGDARHLLVKQHDGLTSRWHMRWKGGSVAVPSAVSAQRPSLRPQLLRAAV